MAPRRLLNRASLYRWHIVVAVLIVQAIVIVALALVYSTVRSTSSRQEAQLKLTRGEIQNQVDIRDATATALWDRYDNDIFACRRGNTVRGHIRGNDTAIKSLAEILAPYLTTSAALRRAAASGDKAAAQALAAAESIATVAKGITPIPGVKCVKEIRKPGVPRPDTPLVPAKGQKEVIP